MTLENGILTCIDECVPHLVFPKEMIGVNSSGFESFFLLDEKVESITVEEGNPVFRSENNCLIFIEKNMVVLGCKNSVIPEGIEAIGRCAFSRMPLDSVTIPDSVVFIGDFAFADTGLAFFELPSGVKEVGHGILGGFDSPVSVSVHPQNTHFYSEGGCIIETASKTAVAFAKNAVIPDDVKAIDVLSMMLFDEEDVVITVPASVESIGVADIGIPPWVEFPVCFKTPKDSFAARFAAEHGIKTELI